MFVYVCLYFVVLLLILLLLFTIFHRKGLVFPAIRRAQHQERADLPEQRGLEAHVHRHVDALVVASRSRLDLLRVLLYGLFVYVLCCVSYIIASLLFFSRSRLDVLRLDDEVTGRPLVAWRRLDTGVVGAGLLGVVHKPF